jgi:Uma2 family endonuclease
MPWPDHLLTLQEWAQLPEETFRRTELVEGVVQVVPQPLLHHQRAMARLVEELDRQLPHELTAVPNAELTVFEAFPPTVRVPDVSVLSTARYDTNPARIAAQDVGSSISQT